MKHCILILTAIVILMGCKPKSGSNSKFNLPEVVDVKNNNTSINTRNWPDFKVKAGEGLLRSYAEKHNIPDSRVNDFIICGLNSLASYYPEGKFDFQGEEAQSILQKCENGSSNNQSNSTNNSPSQPNNNFGNSGKWSSGYRDQMEQELKKYARKEAAGLRADEFVNCAISSLEAKYPNENIDWENSEAQAILNDCKAKYSGDRDQLDNNRSNNSNNYNSNPQSWSAADQQEFMSNCVPGASKSLGNRAGQDYCNCMLGKIMQESPNAKDAGNISKSHLTELAVACKKSVYD